jgi:hypothetical protein
MSWWTARPSVMTKMFSLSKMSFAGSESAILIGISRTPFVDFTARREARCIYYTVKPRDTQQKIL